MTMYFQILSLFVFIVAVVLVWLALVSVASLPFWFFGDAVGHIASLVICVLTTPLAIMAGITVLSKL